MNEILAPVLRIGVTGHRQLSNPDRVRADVESAIAAVAALSAGAIGRGAIGEGEARVGSGLRVVSALAEGADRIVAQAGLDAGAALQCPLPFLRDRYERDFASDASKAEFRRLLAAADAVFEIEGGGGADGSAYEAAGRVLVAQSDLLIAVWDGGPGHGRGGTAETVRDALAASLPVIAVDPDGRRPPALLSEGSIEKQAGLQAALAPYVAGLLGSSSASSELAFLAEAACGDEGIWSRFGGLFIAFRDLVHLAAHAPASATASTLASKAEGGAAMAQLIALHDLADRAASRYAGLYRSAYLMNFLLSAAAVAAALLGILAHRLESAGLILELVAIGAILAVTRRGRKRAWHDRWIDCRHLAEHLRPLRFLFPLGAPLPRTSPAGLAAARNAGSQADRLARLVERWLGLPNAVLTHDRLIALRRDLVEGQLSGQIAYHRANAHRMHLVEERLHGIGEALFAATVVACFAHLVLVLAGGFHLFGEVGEWAERVAEGPFGRGLTMLAAVFPALGAALLGIRNIGEFHRLSLRSGTMAAALESRSEALSAVLDASLDYVTLLRAAQDVAGLMISETADWRTLVILKPLELPG